MVIVTSLVMWLAPWGLDEPFIIEKGTGNSLTFKQALAPGREAVFIKAVCKKIRIDVRNQLITRLACPTLSQIRVMPAYTLSTGRVNRLRVTWHLKTKSDDIQSDVFLEFNEIVKLVKPQYRASFSDTIEAVT